MCYIYFISHLQRSHLPVWISYVLNAERQTTQEGDLSLFYEKFVLGQEEL